MAIRDYNPFAKRSEYSSRNLLAYKIFTIVSWLLVVIPAVYYVFKSPSDCKHHCHTIWGQNSRRPTPFSLNPITIDIYWIVMLLMQAHYVRYLWSGDATMVTAAASVGSHFIVNNLLTFGFIMLWVRGRFWIGELLLAINFFNLTSLYFRHSSTPRFVHIPIVSAPYAWTVVALLWDGAAMVNARSLPARILANIAIWIILVDGAFFVLFLRDYSMGFEFTFLSLSLALAQLGTKVIALQWIFAFVIMGVLLFLSLLVAIPGILGERRQAVVSDSGERAPLLNNN